MRMFFALLVACGVMASLGACALPDLVAHTVKEVEKSQRGGSSSPSAASSSRPASSSSSSEMDEPPPPQPAPAPRKSSVTAEELPPQ